MYINNLAYLIHDFNRFPTLALAKHASKCPFPALNPKKMKIAETFSLLSNLQVSVLDGLVVVGVTVGHHPGDVTK
jgi:hypothetical protein